MCEIINFEQNNAIFKKNGLKSDVLIANIII